MWLVSQVSSYLWSEKYGFVKLVISLVPLYVQQVRSNVLLIVCGRSSTTRCVAEENLFWGVMNLAVHVVAHIHTTAEERLQ